MSDDLPEKLAILLQTSEIRSLDALAWGVRKVYDLSAEWTAYEVLTWLQTGMKEVPSDAKT